MKVLKAAAWFLIFALACSGPSDPEPSRYRLVVVSGDGQEATVTETLDDPLVFKLRDQHGEAKSGIRVVFEFSQGSGSFDPAEAITDSNGKVATVLTLGTVAGTVIIAPEISDLSDLESVATMSATARPDEPVALAWVSGNGQKDAPGAELQAPLALEAQDAHGNAVAGVMATLTAGEGSSVSPGSLVSEEDQAVHCAWTLGDEYGDYSLTANADGLTPATASAEADLAPVLAGIQYAQPADEGDPITLIGENFCAEAAYNSVTLGGLPMEVVEAAEDELTALVPVGAPLGVHEIALSVGSQSAAHHFEVDVSLALGRVKDYPMLDGEVQVPVSSSSANTSYIAMVYNLRDTAPYEFDWVELEEAPAPLAPAPMADFLEGFHRRMLSVSGEGEPGPRRAQPADRDRVTFNVFSDIFGNTTDPSDYISVSATLRYQGDHVRLYMDDRDVIRLSQSDCNELGQTFEQQIYDVDRAAFGAESDYDGNGRVNILLTRQVNLLTGQIDDDPSWGGEYVGGFFNPVDLPIWSWPEGTSNEGEIFYGIVPDPDKEFSKVAHTAESTVASLKPILAHEFQHMINFYQRHAVLGGGSQQIPGADLWVNEGLSHLAEDLCGFHEQNRARVKIYLHSRLHRSIALASLGEVSVGNSLGERGASYLFIRYLADRWPGSQEDLVKSIVSGRENVSQATGETFEQVFKDWLAALVLDDSGLSEDPRYQFTSLNIRTDFPYGDEAQEPLSYFILDLDEPDWSSIVVPGSFDLLGLEASMPGEVTELRFSSQDRARAGVLLIRTGL